MASGPNTHGSMEKMLQDYQTRLTLVERRLAVVGGGSSTPYDAEAGMVMAFGGPTPPEGWLFCDGSLLSRTAYPELFAAIGTTYGNGDGSTTFPLPNYKGRVLVGRDTAQAEFDVLGEVGGAKTHTLTVGEIPAHQHIEGYAGVNATAAYGVSTAPAGNLNGQSGTSTSNHANSSLTGGGGAHNNLQPYAVSNYIISTGKGVGGGSAARSSGGTTPYDALPGIISPFAGATPPSGWLPCDGSAVSRSTYPRLFTAIGTTYGAGDGASTFNLPNLKGKVAVGQDTSQTEFDVLGEAGGAKTVTLTVAQMPNHKHGLRRSGNEASNYGAQAGGGFADRMIVTGATVDTYTDVAGSDQPHNNLQPYIVTNYIISTGAPIGGGGSSTPSLPDPVTVIPNDTQTVAAGSGVWEDMTATAPRTASVTMAFAYACWVQIDFGAQVTAINASNYAMVGVNITGALVLPPTKDQATGQDPIFNYGPFSATAGNNRQQSVKTVLVPAGTTTFTLQKRRNSATTDASLSYAGMTVNPLRWAGAPGASVDMTRGTTAQRDALYPLPSTDAERAALANRLIEWFNTDKGYDEIYYATTGLAGLTVRGLISPHPSGWYPKAGTAMFATVKRGVDQSAAAGAETIISYDTLMASENFPVTLPNQKLRIPIGGKYEIAAAATAQQTGGNYLNLYLSIGGTNQRLESGAVFPHTNAWSRADLNSSVWTIAAGTDVWTPTVCSSAGVIAGGSPYFTIKYLAPPLVNS